MVHTVAHTQCHTETDRHIRADIHTVPNEVFASACLSQRTSHFMRSRHIRPLLVACAGRDQSPQTHACRVCAVVHALQAPVASKPAHRQDGCTYFAQPLQSLQLLRSQVEARLSPDCAHDASHQKDFFTTSSSETRSFDDVASCSLVAFLEEAAAEEAGHASLPPEGIAVVAWLHA